jgi:hypothetical protein
MIVWSAIKTHLAAQDALRLRSNIMLWCCATTPEKPTLMNPQCDRRPKPRLRPSRDTIILATLAALLFGANVAANIFPKAIEQLLWNFFGESSSFLLWLSFGIVFCFALVAYQVDHLRAVRANALPPCQSKRPATARYCLRRCNAQCPTGWRRWVAYCPCASPSALTLANRWARPLQHAHLTQRRSRCTMPPQPTAHPG